MKNYLNQSLGFSALILFLTGGLYFIPADMDLGPFSLRKMDLLADVRPTTVEEAPSDSLGGFVPDTMAYMLPDSTMLDTLAQDSMHVEGPLPPLDSVKWGNTIEDYTHDQPAMGAFFAAVDSIRTHGRTVRVAFFGDSFIEGDILVGDLRDTLQSLWGGNGVGFVPITSEVARFKRTLVHEYRGWETYSIVKNRNNKVPFGINGFVYHPNEGASIHYQGADYFHHTRYWSQIRLFYRADSPTRLFWQNGKNGGQEITLPAKNGLATWKWGLATPEIRSMNLNFPASDSNFWVYGASLESGPGIYLDNFSIRGNTGGPLRLIRQDLMQQFDQMQQYDLIVLQVGLNAVTNSLNNINWYRAELDRTFDHLRACFPGKPILIMSVGDRCGKVGDEIRTMRGVPYIVAMQRDLARKHGFLFYDLFRGMGGPNTMLAMANHKPMLANRDYTHLTHEGGKVVAYMLTDLLLREQARYRATQTQ